MTAPIIIYRPLLRLQPLDAAGDPDGAEVDVSCDMQSVELGVDQPLITTATFCGKFQTPGDIEESATLEVAVNPDTATRWAALVGKTVDASLFDRTDHDVSGGKYRKFRTFIGLDPSLYGTTTPDEARTISFDVPIIDSPTWQTVAP